MCTCEKSWPEQAVGSSMKSRLTSAAAPQAAVTQCSGSLSLGRAAAAGRARTTRILTRSAP